MRCVHGAFVEYIYFIIDIVSPFDGQNEDTIESIELKWFFCVSIYIYIHCLICGTCKSSTNNSNQNCAPATWICVSIVWCLRCASKAWQTKVMPSHDTNYIYIHFHANIDSVLISYSLISLIFLLFLSIINFRVTKLHCPWRCVRIVSRKN